MAAPDYTALDAAIVDRISRGATERYLLVQALWNEQHHAFLAALGAEPKSGEPLHELIDRRLQALRRAGRIKYERKSWRIA